MYGGLLLPIIRSIGIVHDSFLIPHLTPFFAPPPPPAHQTGIVPAPKGIPQIEVSFDIDADGIVNVSAKDKATGRDQSMSIVASSGLSSTEIENMIHEAEKFAESDAKRKNTIEATNVAESVINETEKNVAEYKDKLDSADVEKINGLIAGLRESIAKGENADAEEIRKQVGEVQQGSLKLFEMVYKVCMRGWG